MPAAAHPRRPRRRRRRCGCLRGKAPRDVGWISGGDVEIDNGPAELLHQAPSEVRKCIEPGGMTALERDLQRVLADELDVLHPQLFVAERLHARQPSRHACLAPTLRARARPPQLLARVGRARAVLPGDLHDLTRAVDVDVAGKRVWALRASAQRTLMTGG